MSELLWGKNCEELKYPTFCQVVCEILIIITYSTAKKVRDSNIFIMI